MAITGKRNAEMVDLLSADFRRVWNPAHAWADSHSMIMSMVRLIGYWPGALEYGAADTVRDHSGGGNHLTISGSVSVTVSSATPIPCLFVFGGSADYMYIADAAKNSPAVNLTVASWVQFDQTATARGASECLISKWTGTGNQRAFSLVRHSSGVAFIYVSDDGATSLTAQSTLDIDDASTWHFIAGRITASTEKAIFVDGTWTKSATNLPTGIFDSTADLRLGIQADGNSDLDGRLAQPFMCAEALPDWMIETYYEMTAPMFVNELP